MVKWSCRIWILKVQFWNQGQGLGLGNYMQGQGIRVMESRLGNKKGEGIKVRELVRKFGNESEGQRMRVAAREFGLGLENQCQGLDYDYGFWAKVRGLGNQGLRIRVGASGLRNQVYLVGNSGIRGRIRELGLGLGNLDQGLGIKVWELGFGNKGQGIRVRE